MVDKLTSDLETPGYMMAAHCSMVLSQQAIRERETDFLDHWHAPGWAGISWVQMPNPGQCKCGEFFEVTEVYHYYASCDGKWHTRYRCYQVGESE